MLTRSRHVLVAAAALGAVTAAACSPQAIPASVPATTPYVITILNYTVYPADLAVPPNTTVLVLNEDDFAHWLESEAAPGDFVYAEKGGVGFSLFLEGSSAGTFLVPATAVVGTVVPYFCFLSNVAMLNQGTLTIVPPVAAASAPPDTTPAR